jgi:hypothetical protein
MPNDHGKPTLDVRGIVSLLAGPVQRLAHFMRRGEHIEPATARTVLNSINETLDVVQIVCDGHNLNFAEVMALLHPLDHLLIALKMAADSGRGAVWTKDEKARVESLT